MLKRSIGAVALGCLMLAGGAQAQEKIKVGVTATLEGTYTVLGEDGDRKSTRLNSSSLPPTLVPYFFNAV